MVKVSVDIQATVGPKTGLGTYTHHLTEALKSQESDVSGLEISFFKDSQSKNSWNTLDRWYWENIRRMKQVKKDKADLFHVPAFAGPFIKNCKLLMTAHDLIGMLFPNQIGHVSRFYWGKWLPMTIKRADHILADSENTKRDIIEYLSISEKKISVVYPSGHEGFSSDISENKIQAAKDNFKIRSKYLLFVGTIEPRKNLKRVIQAFIKFRNQDKSNHDYQLVVVGSRDFAHGKFYQTLMQETELSEGDIVFTDYVGHEDLNALYSGAEVFLYPSLYEGFGIPVLEAMASGCPVLASDTSSVPEVAGDAAYLVDPVNIDKIAEGIQVIASDDKLKSEMRDKGFKQINKFSWEKAAKETLNVYQSLVS